MKKIGVFGFPFSGAEQFLNKYDYTISDKYPKFKPPINLIAKLFNNEYINNYNNFVETRFNSQLDKVIVWLKEIYPYGVWPAADDFFNILQYPIPDFAVAVSPDKILSANALGILPDDFKFYVFLGNPDIILGKSIEIVNRFNIFISEHNFESTILGQINSFVKMHKAIKNDFDTIYRRFLGDLQPCMSITNVKLITFDKSGEQILDSIIKGFKYDSYPDYAGTAITQHIKNYIQNLTDGKKLDIPSAIEITGDSYIQNSDQWYCVRIDEFVSRQQCHKCIESGGAAVAVINRRTPEENLKLPCAYECVYTHEKHKTIEESIKNHNWGMLP